MILSTCVLRWSSNRHWLRGLAVCLCLQHYADAVHSCPLGPTYLQSVAGKTKATQVEFKNGTPVQLKVSYVDSHGNEHLTGVIEADTVQLQDTFEGHVFRFASMQDSVLVFDFKVGKSSELSGPVVIPDCAELKAPIDASWSAMDSLVHDQNAPCLPANDSAKWSCVRHVPKDQYHVPADLYGFADEAEAGHRPVHKTYDEGYYNHVDFIPRVTSGPGFLKMSMPDELRSWLIDWYADRKLDSLRQEDSIAGGYANDARHPFFRVNLDLFPTQHNRIKKEMKTVAEWWCKQRLVHHATFGIRVYKRHAMLINHVDVDRTHLASAVLQIAQEVDENGGWPLEVIGEDGEYYEVYLQPGEMVLYEGAKLRHGRPMRMRGTDFANIFSHFAPPDWAGVSAAKAKGRKDNKEL